jgi:hypothetical protein
LGLATAFCLVVNARRNPEVVPGKNIYEMEDGSKAWFELVIYGGRKPMGIDAFDWCCKEEELGAGEPCLPAWIGTESISSTISWEGFFNRGLDEKTNRLRLKISWRYPIG